MSEIKSWHKTIWGLKNILVNFEILIIDDESYLTLESRVPLHLIKYRYAESQEKFHA